MKQEKPQRRNVTVKRQSSASNILGGRSRALPGENYGSFDWLILFATFLTIVLVSFLFTPYTHQLDEIKNVLLLIFPPIILLVALWKMDFSAITWKHHGALILLGLYFLWMCISWLVNPYKIVGERVIWFNAGVAAFAVLFAWYMNTENKVRKTMIFFVSLSLISSVFGLFLYAGRYTSGFYQSMLTSSYWQDPARRPWATLVYTLTSSSGDMYSFILNSDFYAAFLVMLIPIALSMFFVEQRIGFKIMALATVLLMQVCLFLTNSNDSFIAMFLFVYPLYFLLGKKYVGNWNLSHNFVVSFMACTAVLLVFVGIMMLPKLSATFDFKTAAFDGRRVLWGGGFWPWLYGDNVNADKVDITSIIFGTGPGGYRHYFPWFRRPDFFDQQINNVTTFGHNFYLDVLLETGLVGLLLFVGFHVRVIGDAVHQIRTTASRTHLLYQLALVSGLVGIAVQNFSSPNNRWAVAGMIYWTLFGLSMGLVYLERPRTTGENASRKIGQFPVYKIAHYVAMAFAGLFILRCIVPGQQAFNYWTAAKQNAEGIRAMETVAPTREQQMQLMDRARIHFETAIENNPTFATSYYKLGHVYNQLGRPEKAIETYVKLNEINANYSEVHLNLGIMYAQQSGSLPASLRALEQKANELLVQARSTTGARRTQLETEYGEIMEQVNSQKQNIDKIQLELLRKSFSHMQEAAHQSWKPNTQYLAGSIGLELMSSYEDAGETEKAAELLESVKKYFNSIVTYKPKLDELQADQREYYPKAQRQLLSLAERTNNRDESITVLQQMVKDNPESDVMLRALLESYDRAGRTEDKLAYLEEAVHSDPTNPTIRQELAAAYKLAGRQADYIRELRKVEVLTPQDPLVLQDLFKAYTEANQTERATVYADKLTSLGIPLNLPTADEQSTTASETSTASAATTGSVEEEPSAPPVETTATAPLAQETTAPIAAIAETTPTEAIIEAETTATDEITTEAGPPPVETPMPAL